jgi:hypothetical protein
MRRAAQQIEHMGRPGYGDDDTWLALIEEDGEGKRVIAEYFQATWSTPLVAMGLASTPIPRRNERPY